MSQILEICPIGFLSTPYTKKYHAPRQPAIDDRIDLSEIRLNPHCNYEQALEDLEGFDRIWLLFWFDKTNSWKPKILTPRDRTKRGVFATRSPHRPNPIGMSVVDLVSIDGLSVLVRGTDLLDGTPIIDIKPYLPYADSFPQSRIGWVESVRSAEYHVHWNDAVVSYEFRAHVDRILRFDPFPHPYRRIDSSVEGGYVMAYQDYRIEFTIEDREVTIVTVKKVGITP